MSACEVTVMEVTVMDEQTFAIRFPDLELGEAGKAVEGLKAQILDDVPEAKLQVRKDDPTNQDFGATLIAVLGTPAILAAARGIATWLKRRGQTIEVELDGEKTTFRA